MSAGKASQCASLWYLRLGGLWGYGCPGGVGVIPSSVGAVSIAETRMGDRGGHGMETEVGSWRELCL